MSSPSPKPAARFRRAAWFAGGMAAMAMLTASLHMLPAEFVHLDQSSFDRDRFGVRVGMTEHEARSAILRNHRFRYAGRRDCTVTEGGELYGCADATEIEQYRVDGLLRDGQVAIGMRDGRVIYIFADQVKAKKI